MLLNGIPGEFFYCRRGLRQGDPLSPLLFILCIDSFYRMMHQAVSRSLLPAVGVGDLSIHSLQFADDLLLFLDGSARSAKVTKFLLDAFTAASGLKINSAKSSFIPINLEAVWAADLAAFLGCPIGSFPITYLGFPLAPKALHKPDYLPLIEKISKRLAGWKGSLLSRGGRLVLLNSVLSSVPAFFCSTFRLPSWVIKEIDKIRRGFFWKGRLLKNGFHCLAKWEHVCRPKLQGGLGIRNIRAMNEALLMKHLWKFYCIDPLPWVKLVKLLHYKRRTLSSGGPPPIASSPFWRGVLHSSTPFHTSISHSLGDGARTPFWHAR